MTSSKSDPAPPSARPQPENLLTDAASYFGATSVPVMPSSDVGLLFFVLCCILPGVGTIISAFFDKLRDTNGVHVPTVIVGILQLCLSWLVIGWVWSCYWGFLIYEVSKEEEAFERSMFGRGVPMATAVPATSTAAITAV